MSTIPASIRGKSWIPPVTVLSIVLGVLLAASLKTQQRIKTDLGVPSRLPLVAAALKEQKEVNEGLQKQISVLRAQNTKYEEQMAQGTNQAKTLNDELQSMKFLAGLTPVKGSGIVVNLHDSTEPTPKDAPGIMIQEYLAHDSDIRAITNELRAAGAEVISVNNQRLIATSGIRCVGPVVMVNGIPVAAPFIIKAIGDSDALSSALKMKGGVTDELGLLGMIDIQKQKDITIPGYSGSVQFRYAKTAD